MRASRDSLRIAHGAGALLLALLMSVLFARAPLAVEPDPESPDPAARGAYVLRAAGCATCHTDVAKGGAFLAGGRMLTSPWGAIAAPNITPDPETGIGGWSDEDLVRALRDGKSPEGRTYYPAFPYTAYSGMRREDMLDLKAYLDTVEPVAAPNKPHELRFPFSVRLFLHPWRWLFFDPSPEEPGSAPDERLARGRYLVETLGHCSECHTPRNMLGALKPGLHLAGSRYGPGGLSVPNITPDVETGIGSWSEIDLAFFLRTGFTPYGDDVQGEMREAIDDGLRHLTQADLEAMAAYLKALQAIRNPVSPTPSPPPAFSSGGDW
ncbi:MAG: cytochrome c [Rhodospirillales bacterium]|nr:cytochrome c [Rhodospirillales bacterium]